MLKASKIFCVPDNTVRDRVLGIVDTYIVIMGKVPLFDQLEGAIIVKHFKNMADSGYGYTQQSMLPHNMLST